MTKEQSLNLIIQVVLTRAQGNSVEIDNWKQALQILKDLVEKKPETVEPEEVKK
jgi:hypothetical protein